MDRIDLYRNLCNLKVMIRTEQKHKCANQKVINNLRKEFKAKLSVYQMLYGKVKIW